MTTICGYKVHEEAEMFPLITGDDFTAFVEDMRLNGQMEPIALTPAGEIIDGRNRARACELLGIEPKTITYAGNDIRQFVASHNLHRRHLTESQRAMYAAERATRPIGQRNQMLTDTHLPPTQTEMADLMAVSRSSVTAARRIITNGVPELAQLVKDGLAPVATAARAAKVMSPEEQTTYVEQVRSGADPIGAAGPNEDQRRWNEGRKNAPPKRDPFHKRTRYMDPERIIENAVGTLEGIATALELVKGTTPSLDKEKRTAWLEALRGPLSAINTLKKELAS